MAQRTAVGASRTGSRRWDPIRLLADPDCVVCGLLAHIPFHTPAGRPLTAGPKVRYCHDLRPMTGVALVGAQPDRLPALCLDVGGQAVEQEGFGSGQADREE